MSTKLQHAYKGSFIYKPKISALLPSFWISRLSRATRGEKWDWLYRNETDYTTAV